MAAETPVFLLAGISIQTDVYSRDLSPRNSTELEQALVAIQGIKFNIMKNYDPLSGPTSSEEGYDYSSNFTQ